MATRRSARLNRTLDTRRRIDGLLGAPQISRSQMTKLNGELQRAIENPVSKAHEREQHFDRQLARLPALKDFEPGPGEKGLIRTLRANAKERARAPLRPPVDYPSADPTISSGSVLTIFGPPYPQKTVSGGSGSTFANAFAGTFRAGTGGNSAVNCALWSFFRPVRAGVLVRFTPLFNTNFRCFLDTYQFFLWPGSPSRASAFVFMGAFVIGIFPDGSTFKLADQRVPLIDSRVSIRDSLSIDDGTVQGVTAFFITPPPEVTVALAAWGGVTTSASGPGGFGFAQADMFAQVPFEVLEQFL